jgi:putative GTP pyrophosphokinase
MSKRKSLNREKFLKKYKIRDKFEEVERKGKLSWEDCEKIYENYKYDRLDDYQETRESIIKKIWDIHGVHSIRSRCKDPESLITKIIKKKYNGGYKYSGINADNYYCYITDLVGVRILLRQRNQWADVHRNLVKIFSNEPKNYVQDYAKDYSHNAESSYIAEKPQLYFVHNADKPMYSIFGSNVFDMIVSQRGYSSIHYTVNYHGRYVEIQVRTLYEEAWSEVDHDYVYKEEDDLKKERMKKFSKVMSDISSLGNNLGTMLEKHSLSKKANIESLSCDNKNETMEILCGMTHILNNFSALIRKPDTNIEQYDQCFDRTGTAVERFDPKWKTVNDLLKFR